MSSELEEYITQCGEIYLTVGGNIAMHCILCEAIYKNFVDYANHTKIHYQEYGEDETFIDTKAQIECESADGNCKFSTNDAPELTEDIMENEAMPTDSYDPLLIKNGTIHRRLNHKPIKETDKPRKHKCPLCDYACCDKSNLTAHIKRHSLEKPHKCEECAKTFYVKKELNIHLRTHTGEKPYLCPECGVSFKTTSHLREHRKRHLKNRDKKCMFCNYACYDSSSLRRHMAIHSDKRNYKCLQCKASFKAKVALWNHEKIHDNKKEYACKLCDSKFNQLAGLYSHMKSSHAVLSS